MRNAETSKNSGSNAPATRLWAVASGLVGDFSCANLVARALESNLASGEDIFTIRTRDVLGPAVGNPKLLVGVDDESHGEGAVWPTRRKKGRGPSEQVGNTRNMDAMASTSRTLSNLGWSDIAVLARLHGNALSGLTSPAQRPGARDATTASTYAKATADKTATLTPGSQRMLGHR